MARTKRARARCSTRAGPPPGRACPNRCVPGAEPHAARRPRVRCRRPESRAVAAARRGAGTRTMAGSRGRGPGAGGRGISAEPIRCGSHERGNVAKAVVGRVSERRPGDSERLSRFLPALCPPAPHSPPPGFRRPVPVVRLPRTSHSPPNARQDAAAATKRLPPVSEGDSTAPGAGWEGGVQPQGQIKRRS